MKKHAVIVLILFGVLAVLPFKSGAFSSEHPGCTGDCRECHNLDKREAETIIKKLNPALKCRRHQTGAGQEPLADRGGRG